MGACGLPGCKPVSVPLRAAVIHLGRSLLDGSSDLPGSKTERTAPPPLFGLAPRGVCPASWVAPAAVRSYRTFSPLPRERRYLFCGTFREIRFERITPAVSRHAALWRPDFPPPVQERLPTRQAKAIMPRSQNLHATQIKQLDSLFASEQFGSILIVVSRKEGPSNCLGSPIVILYLALRLLVLDLI